MYKAVPELLPFKRHKTGVIKKCPIFGKIKINARVCVNEAFVILFLGGILCSTKS